jgi:hypothetical protein
LILKKYHVEAAFFLGLMLCPLMFPEGAEAIPAFSRQHKTECSTCHTIYPELNEFGDAYLKNGYVWPGKQVATGQAKPTQDADSKESKNEWAWISGLPEQIPVSFTASADLAYNSAADNKADLSARSLRLQAGGAFREAAGFYVTYNLYTQGEQRAPSGVEGSPANNPNSPPNETPNIDELFVFWRHALDTPINLRVGRLEPKLSLWKSSDRIIQSPSYASSTYTVGLSPFRIDLPEDALEANAVVGNRLLLAAGIVNRKGQNHKDGYGHASYKIGGTDFKGKEPEVDLESDSIWDFLTITLGTFGYSGRNSQFETAGSPSNDFYRVGGEIDVLYKRLHLKGGGTFGRDSNPSFSDTAAQKSQAYAVEGEYYLGAPIKLIPLFRYEYQEVGGVKTRLYMPAIAYAPLQNTRISLRYIYRDAQTSNRTAVASVEFSL